MLTLSVQRRDGTRLDQREASVVLFYDETVTVKLESPRVCNTHLYVAVQGNLMDREREHIIVIYDEDLPEGKEWSSTIHIRHPRSPLLNPHLEIVATATTNPAEEENEHSEDELDSSAPARNLTPYIPFATARSSFLVPFDPSTGDTQRGEADSRASLGHGRTFSGPGDINFAKPLKGHRKSSTVELYSTAHSKAQASEGKKEDADNKAEHIEVLRWRSPLAQALELEIRSLRPALERDRVIAEVDLVASSHDVRIAVCDVELEDGLADLMGAEFAPIDLRAREQYAMCFNLQLRAAAQLAAVTAARKPLSLSLECEVLLKEPGDAANPRITTVWLPIVDFEGTLGPLPKTPALNFHSTGSPIAPALNAANTLSNGSSSTLDLVGGPRQSSASSLTLMGGVSINITGPQFVKVGETFEWIFKVINRSQRNRLFTISFGSIVRDTRKDLQMPADTLTSISTYNGEMLRRRAISHYRNIGANCGIIPLCQELRVGNLAPHVCFETKIELHALSKGTHTIEAARIEDLTSRDSYDVGSLLEVIVLPHEGVEVT